MQNHLLAEVPVTIQELEQAFDDYLAVDGADQLPNTLPVELAAKMHV